jgi:hypothetical protein
LLAKELPPSTRKNSADKYWGFIIELKYSINISYLCKSTV